MIIVALAGAKGSGKSEVAEMLENHPAADPAPDGPTLVFHLAFGERIKQMLEVMGAPDASLYGNDDQKMVPIPELGGVTGRHLMVTIATEWGRNMVHPDIWVMVIEQELKELEKSYKDTPAKVFVIIDDLRFQNEYDFLKSKGAMILGVERGELPGKMEDQHISEQMPYRFAELGIPVIKNDSTLAELHQKVIALAVPNP